MRRMTVLATVLVLLTTVVVAQTSTNINFSDLNGTKAPKPIADGYYSVNWSGFFYLNGNGMGLERGSNATIGVSGLCGLHCPATISAAAPFSLLGIQVAGGWGDNTLTVTPIRDGIAVGVYVFHLTTAYTTIDFTQYWNGPVDSVVFTPSAGLVVYTGLTIATSAN